ncbi:UNVERIFIED_CONTAM: hypothetical protein RKD50_000679 [Streptomyces canus]
MAAEVQLPGAVRRRGAQERQEVDTAAVAAEPATASAGRRSAGPLASRVTTARRLVPAGTFDKQIRKNNRLPA